MLSGYEFALGLILGFVFSVYAIRYFDKHFPQARPHVHAASGVPYSKKKVERKKPVVIDDAKEWRKEQDQKKKES